MSDMSPAIVPKSDQLNADDLIAGPLTIKIRDVQIRGGQEQPVSIFYDGDNGKPYKSCKSMSRVIVAMWGPDANQYVGRSLTLYRDPTVTWAGMAVGGIRISHMSHIEREMTMALTATKQSRKPFTVRPLAPGKATPPSSGQKNGVSVDDTHDADDHAGKTAAKWSSWATKVTLAVADCKTPEELDAVEERIRSALPGYKDWDAGKWADLMAAISETRSNLMNV